MKLKLMCFMLMGLSGSIVSSNAMDDYMGRLSLTDGKSDNSRSLTSYTSNQNAQKGNRDSIDFSNASQEKLIRIRQFPNNNIRIEALVQYLGKDRHEMANFLDYLEECIDNYTPGMKLKVPQEIAITSEDTINVDLISQYIGRNLFMSFFTHSQKVTPEFKEFKAKSEKAFGSYTYNDNCIMFALVFYMARSEAQALEIENTYYKYNNCRFILSPCQDKMGGKEIPIVFKSNYIDYDSRATVASESPDTISRTIYQYMNGYSALYKFSVFKMGEDTYRLNVKLSSKESTSSFFNDSSSPYIDRQITNILLQIKK